MPTKRKIEVFSAGCPICEEIISLVQSIACPSCDVEVLDLGRAGVAGRAKRYGVRRAPAVVVDGKPAECCVGLEVSEEALRAAGIGVAL